MSITDPLVLPEEVLVMPVSDLSPSVRGRLDWGDDDYAVTRPHGRPGSALVEAESVRLVELFREPHRIVDAIVQLCAETAADPDKTLSDAFPLLRTLYETGLLVEEGSAQAGPVTPVLPTDAHIDRFVVEYCVQSLADSDVYRVRDGEALRALKLVRSPKNVQFAQMLENEHRVLTHLDGTPAPRAVAAGTHEGNPFLAAEWRDGVGAMFAARELRRRGALTELLDLACEIAGAYAALHEREVVHGDVHPENVLVHADGTVSLIDFGIARLKGSGLDDWDRGGVAYFFEPEYAKAVLARKRRPPATALSEQYALAALLYLLITGAHYTDFTVERQAMMREILEEAPKPFTARSTEACPTFEAALAKALRKTPRLRYATVAEFATALRAALPGKRSIARPRTNQATREFRERTLSRLTVDGPDYAMERLKAPTCSVNYGAAGIAYAWYRLAFSKDEPTYLSYADAWCVRAVATAARNPEHDSDAFVNPGVRIHPEKIGACALYHKATGIHCVQALVSHALGNPDSAATAVDAYVREAANLDDQTDLVLGQAGVLLGCALILDALSTSSWVDMAQLIELGNEVSGNLEAQLEGRPLGPQSAKGSLAVAHGVAGRLYAQMRWDATRGTPPPAWIGDRLDELANLNGASNGSEGVQGQLLSSWCSGTAGFVLLWLEANRHFPTRGYVETAERAAMATWLSSERNASLCCGLAGRGFALLALHRETHEHEWLERACRLCDRAAATGVTTDAPYSLFKGDLGIALLAAELERPELARFPVFESEDWRPQ